MSEHQGWLADEATAEIDDAVIGADHGFEGESDPEEDLEADDGRWDFPPPPDYREGREGDAEHAEWDQARIAALYGTTQADRDLADRYLDALYQVQRDEPEAEAG